jgi:hypothetical protein
MKKPGSTAIYRVKDVSPPGALAEGSELSHVQVQRDRYKLSAAEYQKKLDIALDENERLRELRTEIERLRIEYSLVLYEFCEQLTLERQRQTPSFNVRLDDEILSIMSEFSETLIESRKQVAALRTRNEELENFAKEKSPPFEQQSE